MTVSLRQYIPSFVAQLSLLEKAPPTLAPYPASYLDRLLAHKLYYVHIYADVLQKLLAHTNKPLQQLVLADYGAGNGLLGMFAKHCGFGQVILVDTSSIFLQAAQATAGRLGYAIDGYIQGGIEALQTWSRSNTSPDVVAGTDVIEHIYSLDEFFKGLASINARIVSAFTTASVYTNPFKRRQLEQLQKMDEYSGSNPLHALPGDEFAGQPFREIRRSIILSAYNNIEPVALNSLVTATRGMHKAHILQATAAYLQSGHLPQPGHPTNTCDPITGSWTERLLTIDEYKTIYRKAGFDLSVYNGFYNEWQGGVKAVSLKLLNTIIHFSAKQGERITPFITLVGNSANTHQ